ncbi:MAG: tetratricopeptide repeat protein [Chloroflexales bacterium]|nr:tetratricopeptide repeat protein [Chloroflexales bacterium]
MGDNKAAHAMLEQGLAALPAAADTQRADILTNLATVSWLQGEPDQAEARAREALALYERAGQRWKMVTLYQNLGMGKHYAGDWAGAAAEYGRAMEEARALESIVRQVELGLCLGTLANNQGEREAAQRHFEQSIRLARSHQLREQLSLGLSGLAELYLGEGSLEAAVTALDEAAALAAELNLGYQRSELARERAEILLARGDREAALAQAEAACTYGREQENPREEGMGLRVLGQALYAGGRPDEAYKAFARSVELLEDQDPYETARSRAAWGAVRADESGAGLLYAAGSTFERLGAHQDLNSVLSLLRQRGGEHDQEASSLDRLPTDADHDDVCRADEVDPG